MEQLVAKKPPQRAVCGILPGIGEAVVFPRRDCGGQGWGGRGVESGGDADLEGIDQPVQKEQQGNEHRRYRNIA